MVVEWQWWLFYLSDGQYVVVVEWQWWLFYLSDGQYVVVVEWQWWLFYLSDGLFYLSMVSTDHCRRIPAKIFHN